MKISVILPTVDVPHGSGKTFHFLRSSLESVANGGYGDFECLVGCDGHVGEVENVVKSMCDSRFKYIPFEYTGWMGNSQRHLLMKHHASGDVCCFMDHDDAYIPGALKRVAEEVETFPGRLIYFRVELNCGVVVWTERSLDGWKTPVGQGVVIPLEGGWPVWGSTDDRNEDGTFIHAADAYANRLAGGAVWCETVIARIRPWQPRIDSGWIRADEGPYQAL